MPSAFTSDVHGVLRYLALYIAGSPRLPASGKWRMYSTIRHISSSFRTRSSRHGTRAVRGPSS
jgi:hypothetical protein